MTGTCYNFEMEEICSSFLRRAGMPASAGLSCFIFRDKMSKCLEINHSISKELKNDSVCHHKMGSLGGTGKVRLRRLADG